MPSNDGPMTVPITCAGPGTTPEQVVQAIGSHYLNVLPGDVVTLVSRSASQVLLRATEEPPPPGMGTPANAVFQIYRIIPPV